MEGKNNSTNLTPEQHKARHKLLHENLDELIADWIWQTKALPSKNSILDLIEWSYQQTSNPTDAGRF
jgi:hypothetical protein